MGVSRIQMIANASAVALMPVHARMAMVVRVCLFILLLSLLCVLCDDWAVGADDVKPAFPVGCALCAWVE
jgi:hypothetical protein